MFIGYINMAGIVSLSGLLLSLAACVFSFHGQLNMAVICFMYAGIADLFDGPVSRTLKLSEKQKSLGIELDSLIDIVSFGMTPVVIALHSGFDSVIAYVVFGVYLVCAVTRLAWFNSAAKTGTGKPGFYTGLPVTYAALVFPIVFLGYINLTIELRVYLLAVTFLLLSFFFILKVNIPKPKGIFYVIFPVLAIVLTIIWL